MKRWVWAIWIISGVITGCGNQQNTELKVWITGVYVTAYEGNYSIGNDTIEIRLQGKAESNIYLVTKRNAYQRKENRRLKADIQYKRSDWIGTWNESSQTLTIPKNGRTLLFDIEQRQMKIGITVYKKIKML